MSLQDVPDVFGGEALSARGFDSGVIQSFGDGRVVVMIFLEPLSQGHRSRIGTSLLDGSMNRLIGSAFESIMSYDLIQTTDQGNIFDEQASHPFSVPVRSFWILPHFREVFRQSKNLFPGLRCYVLSDQPQPLIFLFGFSVRSSFRTLRDQLKARLQQNMRSAQACSELLNVPELMGCAFDFRVP